MSSRRRRGRDPRSATRRAVDAELGTVYVDVRCKKCTRRWLRLVGNPAGLRRVEFVELGRYPDERWRNPWTGKATGVVPQVEVTDLAAEPLSREETHALLLEGQKWAPRLPRYRVRCHSRCGRDDVYTRSSLEELFASAAESGHADATL